MSLRFVLLILGFLLAAGCASRPQVELDIARSEVAKAYASGAKVLATVEYEAASAALHVAENLVYHERYQRAREALNLALLQAAKASEIAREKAVELGTQHQADLRAKKIAKKKVIKPVKKKPAPPKPKPKPKPVPPKPKFVLLDQVVVTEGETLYSLSGRKNIYNDSLLWPLIYRANRDQIKDPQQIYKGQVFAIPRDKNQQEQEAARKEASESDLFPRQ